MLGASPRFFTLNQIREVSLISRLGGSLHLGVAEKPTVPEVLRLINISHPPFKM